MERYKEIILEAKMLYSGGTHLLKMWIHGVESGFLVHDCVQKKTTSFSNFKEAKFYFQSL